MPDKPHIHTAKFRRCVEEVEAKNPDVNAFAVCMASIGKEEALLSDGQADQTDAENFVWNGKGALGKPFKRASSLDAGIARAAWALRREGKPTPEYDAARRDHAVNLGKIPPQFLKHVKKKKDGDEDEDDGETKKKKLPPWLQKK